MMLQVTTHNRATKLISSGVMVYFSKLLQSKLIKY